MTPAEAIYEAKRVAREELEAVAQKFTDTTGLEINTVYFNYIVTSELGTLNHKSIHVQNVEVEVKI